MVENTTENMENVGSTVVENEINNEIENELKNVQAEAENELEACMEYTRGCEAFRRVVQDVCTDEGCRRYGEEYFRFNEEADRRISCKSHRKYLREVWLW